jgi:hypothetical protein
MIKNVCLTYPSYYFENKQLIPLEGYYLSFFLIFLQICTKHRLSFYYNLACALYNIVIKVHEQSIVSHVHGKLETKRDRAPHTYEPSGCVMNK